MTKTMLLPVAGCLCALAAAESALSEAQRSQLQKISSGQVGKHELELVLARFDEDASWSDSYASVRTIYCKGEQVSGCVPLENVGREGHTYLHHIVQNYDKLADWTVFSQAGAPGVGYNGHSLGGGHLQPGIEMHDYLLREQARDSFFVFTGAIHLPTLFHATRSSYLFLPATPEEQLEVGGQCPKNTEASDRWERLDLPRWFRSMMASKCGFPEGGLQEFLQKYWLEHVNSNMPEDGMLFFSQGARFAVSKERLHQRSKEEYMDLLKLLSGSADPCENYLNEWLWYYIMGKPQEAPCTVQDISVEAPVSAAVRFLSGVSTTAAATTAASGNGTTAAPATTAASGNGTGGASGNGTTAAPSGTTEKKQEVSGALSRFGALATGVAAVLLVAH